MHTVIISLAALVSALVVLSLRRMRTDSRDQNVMLSRMIHRRAK